MWNWFEKQAPIRVKFRFLLYVHGAIGAVSTLAAWMTYLRPNIAAPIVAFAMLVVSILTVIKSGNLICTPYVNTVVRMEALAEGDLISPVGYVDHGDCVGRMTKAMAVFRDNAVKVKAISETQTRIINGELGKGLEQLAARDLTYSIDVSFPVEFEPLRQSFNHAVAGLHASLAGVAGSAQSVHSGSTEISSAAEDLARRTEVQAASLEETAAALDQVTTMIATSARTAKDMRLAVGDAHKEATEGGEVVKRAVAAMGAIEASSEQVNAIIDVIEGIAFQTNLLALNARVEAARAGEAGMGFAVVANEVRSLAQRSADAAKVIKDLIAVSSGHVSQGVDLVGQTGTMLERIVSKVSGINSLVAEMAAGTESQAISLQEVNSAVIEMDKTTQQNAAMVEQTTAATRNLSGEADELALLVAQFKLSTSNQIVHLSQAVENRLPKELSYSRLARTSGTNHRAISGNLATSSKEERDWQAF